MIDREWTPKQLGNLKEQAEALKLRIKSDLPVEEVSRMTLEAVMFASSLTQSINQARWHEAKMQSEKSRAFTTAFLTAVGSDRKREAEAKASGEVRVAEAKAIEAEFYRKLLEEIKDDFIRIHYVLKDMLKDKTEGRKWEQ